MECIEQMILPACWTAFCLIGGLACYYCSSRLLLKRKRDEDPSLELDSKKARLDDQGTSSDPSARAEVNPGVSQVPPEPATHEVENVAEEPQYGDLPDMGDDRSIIALDDPVSLLNAICDHFSECFETTGTALPTEWSLPEFCREVIGEEAVLDPSYLSDVLSDLSLHGLQSWYWVEAEQLLTLITSSVM